LAVSLAWATVTFTGAPTAASTSSGVISAQTRSSSGGAASVSVAAAALLEVGSAAGEAASLAVGAASSVLVGEASSVLVGEASLVVVAEVLVSLLVTLRSLPHALTLSAHQRRGRQRLGGVAFWA